MTTRQQLAAYLGTVCSAVDSPAGFAAAQSVDHLASIEAANASSLVFATDASTLAAARNSAAGTILASVALRSPDSASAADDRILWVPDARFAFASAAQLLRPPSAEMGVHPSAILGQDVRIGHGTSVGPGVVLGDGVVLGQDCRIDARVTIYPGTELGDRVQVQAGAVLGSAGFGYVRNRETGAYLPFPQQGRLIIENDVEIGANSTVDKGALGETRIGQGTKIDNLVHVGHNVHIGRNVVIAAQTGISGSSVIEDGAIVAGQVGIAEHVTIGAGVILGAKCGVPTGKKLRGAGEVFWGIPARPIREYLRDLAKLRRS